MFQQLDKLPKPALILCDSAVRSVTIVLMYIPTWQGISVDQAFKQAVNFGLL